MMRRAAATLLLWHSLSGAQPSFPGDMPHLAFPIPDHYQLINDYNGALRISMAVEISNRLQALEKHNGTQIVFLSVPHVGPEGVDAYAMRVFEKWDLGNNGQGNGVLFFGSMDGATIVTGPGIAGALPDVKVSRIFREIVEPRWKREQFAEAIETAIDAMIKESMAETTAPTFYDYLHPYAPTKPEHWLIGALAAFGIGYGAVVVRRQRRRQAAIS